MPKLLTTTLVRSSQFWIRNRLKPINKHLLQEKVHARRIVAEGIGDTGHDDGDDQERLEQKTDIALQEGNGGIQGALKLIQDGVENAGFHGYCHPSGVMP